MIFPGFRFIAQTLNEVDGVELENFVMTDVFNEGCKIYERLHFVAFDVIVCPLNIKVKAVLLLPTMRLAILQLLLIFPFVSPAVESKTGKNAAGGSHTKVSR